MDKFIALIALALGVIILALTFITAWRWIGSNKASRSVPLWRVLLFFDVVFILAFLSALVLILNNTSLLNPVLIAVSSAGVSGFIYIAVRTGTSTIEELKETLISAEEKEALLRELHHRVKNNLQVIISILKLQRLKPMDKQAHQLIADCESRIFSMALIHENLYRSNNFTAISFSSYVEHLLKEIIHASCSDNVTGVRTKIHCSDIHMKMEQLVPLGIIMNELAVNSIRHGFKNSSGGIIEIEGKLQDNHYVLRYTDNGPGFNEEDILHNEAMLGLELVKALAEQIDARLDIINKDGSTFLLQIPVN